MLKYFRGGYYASTSWSWLHIFFTISVVWCVKYRRKAITEQIEKSLFEILTKIAKDNNFSILEYNTDEDHVHLLIDCSPQNYIPSMLKALKGVSARLLMKKYLESKLFYSYSIRKHRAAS